MKKYLIALILVCCLLVGCGSDDETASVPMAEAARASYDEVYAEAEENWEDYEVNTAMEAETSGAEVTFAQNKKIIYSSSVILETKSYDETYNRLVNLINENGGYIEYENYDNEKRSYLANNDGKGVVVIATNNLIIRIPSKNYSKFMQDGLTLGNVLRRNQTIEDKTSEYNTNKSYVDILNDEAEYLAKQLDVLENELKEAQANDKHYDEIIVNMKDIAERKAQVEKELVPYRSTMDAIDEKVEYSTITMELREVDKFTVIEEEIEEEITFATELKETWTSAMEALSNMFKGTLLFLIRILPVLVYLAIFGAIVFAVVRLVMSISKKNAKRKAKKSTAAMDADNKTNN